MIINTKAEDTHLLFQEWKDDEPAEPAILIEGYSNCIRLTQGENQININYHHVKELIAHLRKMKP